jgi:tetratricopeptide (TPR) repeat protein
MERWRWGNFDQKRLFVDRSYMPSLQTMRVVFIRLARQLVVEGKKDKAIALTDKYFEVFPEYNFPYDQFSAFLADVYFRAGANDKAAAKIREIARTMAQQLKYYQSLSPDFQKAYKQESDYAMGTAQTLLRMASDLKDEALKKELLDMFGSYMPNRPQLPGVQGVDGPR